MKYLIPKNILIEVGIHNTSGKGNGEIKFKSENCRKLPDVEMINKHIYCVPIDSAYLHPKTKLGERG